MKSAQVKRAEAEARQSERAKLTPAQQLSYLEGQIEAGIIKGTAARETKRLKAALLAPAKVVQQNRNLTRI